VRVAPASWAPAGSKAADDQQASWLLARAKFHCGREALTKLARLDPSGRAVCADAAGARASIDPAVINEVSPANRAGRRSLRAIRPRTRCLDTIRSPYCRDRT
jgi:hypothetical protein